jgi:hypothetical protein
MISLLDRINESFHYGTLKGKVEVGRGMCHHPSGNIHSISLSIIAPLSIVGVLTLLLVSIDVWLYENGNDPIKQHSVEIYAVDDYLSWRSEQPQMFLHELTHAYHAHLGGGNVVRIIIDAYNHAMQHKLYDHGMYMYVCMSMISNCRSSILTCFVALPITIVDHCSGIKQRAYAATNVSEYFAELTEAYFGRNDYYPFTRAELQTHDPVGYNMVAKLWSYSAKEIAAMAQPPRPALHH